MKRHRSYHRILVVSQLNTQPPLNLTHQSSPVSLKPSTEHQHTLLCQVPLEGMISRPRRSQGLLYKHLDDSLIESVIVCENNCTAPPRPMVEDGAFSHKIDHVTIF